MSIRAEFEGSYEERERLIEKALKLLKENFGEKVNISHYNPKGIGGYIISSLLVGLEKGIREGGRSAAHKLVDYIFDEIEEGKE